MADTEDRPEHPEFVIRHRRKHQLNFHEGSRIG